MQWCVAQWCVANAMVCQLFSAPRGVAAPILVSVNPFEESSMDRIVVYHNPG